MTTTTPNTRREWVMPQIVEMQPALDAESSKFHNFSENTPVAPNGNPGFGGPAS